MLGIVAAGATFSAEIGRFRQQTCEEGRGSRVRSHATRTGQVARLALRSAATQLGARSQGTTAQKLSVLRPTPPLHTSKPAKTFVRYQPVCKRPLSTACCMKGFRLKVYSFMLPVGT